MNIDKLIPDWETDLLIAKSIGIEYEWMGYDVLRHTDVGAAFFHPSRDIRAAFWAAGKVIDSSFKLDWHESYGIENRTGWNVEINGHCFDTFDETPEMAICKAILALKWGQ